MIGHSFSGKAREAELPEGGKVTVALGHIKRTEDSAPEQAIYTKITDAEGEVVAEYGLVAPSFGVYISLVQEMFQALVPDPA